jgi:hypothetical protein
MKIIAIGSISVLSIVTSLCMSEAFLRWVGIGNPQDVVHVTFQEDLRDQRNWDQGAYIPGGKLRYFYPDNTRGYFDKTINPPAPTKDFSYIFNVTGTINELGYRGPAVSINRTEATTRIALLGDSFTIGYGVRDEEISSRIMEQTLRGLTNKRFEVLNFGITGSATPQQADYFDRYVRRFKPDVVLVIMHLNDVTLTAENGFIGAMSRTRNYLWDFRKNSFLANLVVGVVAKWKLHKQLYDLYQTSFQKNSEAWQRVQQAFIKMRDICAKEGCKMSLVIHPIIYNLSEKYPFQAAHSAVKEFARSNEIASFDLLEALKGQKAEELWVQVADQHPNEKAHRIVGQALANYTLTHMLN